MFEFTPLLIASAFALYLSLIDIKEMRIPNRILLLGMVTTLGAMLISSIALADPLRFAAALAGGVLSVLLFFLIHLAKPRGLGMGDVKFAGLIGASLSWISFPVGLLGLAVAFIASALYAIAIFAIRPKAHHRVIPFAPFMSFGLFFTGFGLLL